MRKFKFRAWDKTQHYWVEAITLTLHTSGNLINLPPDIELQQWTGLTDRQGKDIYEGDIVRWEILESSLDYFIVYDQEYASFIGLRLDKTRGWLRLDNTLKVIGSIYEDR